jgi:hypothetical protein
VTAHTSRRALLAAASPLLLAGCKAVGALGPLPKTAPDVLTLDHAIMAEELIVARYQAALTALGQDKAASLVGALLGEHQEHLDQLKRRLILPPRLATASQAPSPTAPAAPAGRGAVLAGLAAAERAASVRLARQLLGVPPALAQLMASISASEAAHAVLLAQAGRA